MNIVDNFTSQKSDMILMHPALEMVTTYYWNDKEFNYISRVIRKNKK